MTLAEVIMWLTVAVVGVPSMWRNPTAAALVIAWMCGQGVYLLTGDNLPLEFYIFPDVFVLAVIFSKPEACSLAPYRSTLHQLKCIVLERSPCDRIVMAIFPIMWLTYGAALSDYAKWYCLLALCLAQFLAAGLEAFLSHRRDADAADQPDPPGDLLVALRSRGYG